MNTSTVLDEHQNKLEAMLTEWRKEQRLDLAIYAGLGTAIVAAIVWAYSGILTGNHYAFVAILIGLAVGYVVRIAGKGLDQVFGVVGGAFALLGCAFGDILGIYLFTAKEMGVGLPELMEYITVADVLQVYVEDFGFFEVLFYGFAIYEGYRFAFRPIKDSDISALTEEKVQEEQV